MKGLITVSSLLQPLLIEEIWRVLLEAVVRDNIIQITVAYAIC